MTTKKDLLRDEVIIAVKRLFPDISELNMTAWAINDFVDNIENISEENKEEDDEELLPIDRI